MSNTEHPKNFLTVREYAVKSRLSESIIRHALRDGRLKAEDLRMIGQHYIIRKSARLAVKNGGQRTK